MIESPGGDRSPPDAPRPSSLAATLKAEPEGAGLPVSGDPQLTSSGLELTVDQQDEPAGDFPTRLGEYELLEEIGRGGMGIIFKARHERLHRLVAIKMILSSQVASPRNLQRFHIEAAATAQLQHPGIVAIYEVGDHEGRPYFSMEYVDGPSLADRVTDGPLPGSQAGQYLEKIARAVHFAHTRGILHRDLKPANVLIDEQDQPKVTDFGLAKILQMESGQTRVGAVMGTPSYMAPEQAQARPGLGPTCDVYSLGAIFYETLTGRPPFQGESAMATLAMVVDQEPVPPRRLNPKVDQDLESICLKCLEKEQSRRYSSAEALADDLQNYFAGNPINARRQGTLVRGFKWCRRNRAAAALLAFSALAVLAMVAGVLAFGMYQTRIAAAERDLRGEAERQKNEADWQRLEAERSARGARNAGEAARRLLYIARFHLAHHALESADVEHAKELLSRQARDLRSWEWDYLMGRCQGKSVRIVDRHLQGVNGLTFNPSGTRLASAGADGVLRLVDPRTGKSTPGNQELRGVAAALFSPDSGYLIIAGADHLLRLYDAGSLKEIAVLPGANGKVNALAIHRDSNLIAAAGPHGVRLWDLGKREEIEALPDHKSSTLAAAFGSGGNTLACAGVDHKVRLWNLKTREMERVLDGHSLEVAAVAFSPDGRRLATASLDKTIKLWDPATGLEIFNLKGHGDGVSAVAFSPDGKRLASAGRDHTVRIWDTATGQEILMLDAGPGSLHCVAFSPDGGMLACAGQDGLVRIWDGN